MAGLVEVDVAEGKRKEGVEGRSIRLLSEADRRVGDRQDRRVIRAGDDKGEGLRDRIGFAVRQLDGVLDGDGLAGGEVVEHAGTGIEGDFDRAGGGTGILGDAGDADELEQRGGIEGAGIGTHRGGRDAGADDRGGVVGVAEVDVGEREVPGGAEVRGAGLFGQGDGGVGDAEGRGIVDLRDGDGDGGRVGQTAVADGVGDGREGALRVEVVEVQRRSEGQGTIGIDLDGALITKCRGFSGLEDEAADGETGDGLGVAVDLDVVGEDVAGEAEGLVFREGEAVVEGIRGVVDADVQRRGRRERAVGDGVGESRDIRGRRTTSGEAVGRGEGVGAGRVDHQGTLEGVQSVGAVDADGDRRSGGNADRAAAADLDGGHRQGIAFDVGVVVEQVAVDGGETRDDGISLRIRSIVGRSDRDRNRGAGGQLAAGVGVGDHVGDGRQGSVEVGIRGERERTVRVDAEGTETGQFELTGGAVVRGHGDRAGIADDAEGTHLERGDGGLDVGIVGEQAGAGADHERDVLGAGDRVGGGHRRAVDARDDEREGRGAGGAGGVGDGVVDGPGAVPVGGGREGVQARGARDDERAHALGGVGRLGRGDRSVGPEVDGGRARVDRDGGTDGALDGGDAQRLSFDVRVDAGDGKVAVGRTVLGQRTGLAGEVRGVVDGRDVERERARARELGGAGRRLVADDVSDDGHRAVEVFVRREGITSVREEGERAVVRDVVLGRSVRIGVETGDVRRDGADREALDAEDRVRVDVPVVGEHGARAHGRVEQRVLGAVHGLVVRVRRVVHVQRERADGGEAVAVADDVLDGRSGGVEARGRDERERPVGVDGQRAAGDGVGDPESLGDAADLERFDRERVAVGVGRAGLAQVVDAGKQVVGVGIADGDVDDVGVEDRRDVEDVAVDDGAGEGEEIDAAAGDLEGPVAAERRGAGEVVGSRDVGVGEVGEQVDERRARGARADVAAVEQDVGVGGEAAGDRAQVGLAAGQRGGVVTRGAEQELALVAVRDDRDGADVGEVGERGGNLRQSVGFAVDAHDERGRIELADELLPVAHGSVDERDGKRSGRDGRLVGAQVGGDMVHLVAIVHGRGDHGRVIGIQRLGLGRGGGLLGFDGGGTGAGKIVHDVQLGSRDQQLGVEHVAGLQGAQAEAGFLRPTKAPGNVFQIEPFVGHRCGSENRGQKPLGATPKPRGYLTLFYDLTARVATFGKPLPTRHKTMVA